MRLRSAIGAAVLALSLLTAVLVGGCGGDSETQERTLTKKQFVKLTEDFCEREYKAEEREMERYAEKHGLVFGGGKPWEQAKINNVIALAYVRDKIAYFKSLPAPEGDEKEVRGMVEAFEKGLRISEKEPFALAEPKPGEEPLPDPFEDSYETTRAYGPWLCGQP